MEEIINQVVNSGHFQVTHDGHGAVHKSDISLICVGTPSNENGSLSLKYVENVCKEIGSALATKEDYHVIVVRSTVLPGTLEEKLIPILEFHSSRKAGVDLSTFQNAPKGDSKLKDRMYEAVAAAVKFYHEELK